MSLISNILYKQIAQAGATDSGESKLAIVKSSSGSGVMLQFYGEDSQSSKPYKRLSSYTPVSGDVVMVQKINGSYVITGKVV